MTRTKLAPSLALLAAIATCGAIDRIKVRESAESVVERGTIVEQIAGDIGFASFVTFDIAQTEELSNQGVQKHQIDSVHLTSLSLTVVSPASGQDFTFLDRLEFYVEADGLPRERIASGGPFPENETTVTLAVDDLDLAPYATAPSMDITTEVTGRRPQNDTTIRADVELQVDVNIGGIVCGGGKEE